MNKVSVTVLSFFTKKEISNNLQEFITNHSSSLFPLILMKEYEDLERNISQYSIITRKTMGFSLFKELMTLIEEIQDPEYEPYIESIRMEESSYREISKTPIPM